LFNSRAFPTTLDLSLNQVESTMQRQPQLWQGQSSPAFVSSWLQEACQIARNFLESRPVWKR